MSYDMHATNKITAQVQRPARAITTLLRDRRDGMNKKPIS